MARSNLASIETPFGAKVDVPLDRAFAPAEAGVPLTAERVDLPVYAPQTFRAMVLGGPGTGKTTLMKHLVMLCLAGRLGSNGLIPVFVVLRNLARHRHTVPLAIAAAFATHRFPGAERFIQSALDSGRLLVVLDGLDELGPNRDFVVEQIRDFCEQDDARSTRNRVWLTCREHSYRARELADLIPEELHVEPFANHHMRSFLDAWPTVGGRSVSGLYRQIQEDPQIRDICRNPCC